MSHPLPGKKTINGEKTVPKTALAANDNHPTETRSDSRRRCDVLPISLPPRGLSRKQAAAYIGVSPSVYDQLVADGRMPPSKRINRRRVWDRHLVDLAFDDLPSADAAIDDDRMALDDDWTVA